MCLFVRVCVCARVYAHALPDGIRKCCREKKNGETNTEKQTSTKRLCVLIRNQKSLTLVLLPSLFSDSLRATSLCERPYRRTYHIITTTLSLLSALNYRLMKSMEN